MKIIIAGPRDKYAGFNLIDNVLADSGFKITELVCGMANGIDSCAFDWANWSGIAVKEFHPNWTKYGPGAGPMRNGEMAEYADALIAIWDGESKGTKNMIKQAKAKGLKVFVRYI